MRVTSIARRGAGNLTTMLSGRLASQIVLVVSAFIIPRVLGAENFGQYAAVMAVIAIAQTLSSFGLPMVEIRELPPLRSGSDPALAVELGSTIWVTRLILSAIAGAAALVWLAASQELVGASSILIPLGLLAFLRSAYEASRSQLLRSVPSTFTSVSIFSERPWCWWSLSPLFVSLVSMASLRGSPSSS